jgi:hypothetical protein
MNFVKNVNPASCFDITSLMIEVRRSNRRVNFTLEFPEVARWVRFTEVLSVQSGPLESEHVEIDAVMRIEAKIQSLADLQVARDVRLKELTALNPWRPHKLSEKERFMALAQEAELRSNWRASRFYFTLGGSKTMCRSCGQAA